MLKALTNSLNRLKTNLQYLEKDTEENYSELIEKDRQNIRLNIQNIQLNLKIIERCLERGKLNEKYIRKFKQSFICRVRKT